MLQRYMLHVTALHFARYNVAHCTVQRYILHVITLKRIFSQISIKIVKIEKIEKIENRFFKNYAKPFPAKF